MASYKAIMTSQLQHEAQAKFFGKDQHNMIWSECGLIWDCASLVNSNATEAEVPLNGLYVKAKC